MVRQTCPLNLLHYFMPDPLVRVMESRAVLSASLAVAPFAVPTVVSPPTAQHEVVLLGLLRGSYSAHTLPDVGTTYLTRPGHS